MSFGNPFPKWAGPYSTPGQQEKGQLAKGANPRRRPGHFPVARLQ